MIKQGIFLIIWLFASSLFAQSPAKYWIQFEDKQGSTFSIDRPHEFLSYRAIEKRRRLRIPITEEDLPVNKHYIDQVLSLDSTMVLYSQSKWHNGITVYCEKKDIMDDIRTLEHVRFCERTIQMRATEAPFLSWYNYVPQNYHFAQRDSLWMGTDIDYGKSARQIRINNAHWLHRMGYKGEGMLMMFLDGGFHNIDSIRHLSALISENRLFGARNYVSPELSPLRDVSHGTNVLSCVGAYVPGELVGTAPNVSVYVAQTEDKRSENKIEEDNWVAALEWADSLGCDVVNSSLGYTLFDDKEQPRRSHADLTGRNTRTSIAATMAAKRGMIICNSAGNEGNKRWGKLGFPADSKGTLAVAAIDIHGKRAAFSSYGYNNNESIKPDVCAVGQEVYMANPYGKTTCLNGTSFSSPLLAGMITCLWQMFPEKPNDEIMDAVRKSGNQANNPDTLLGYGCPDFLKAYNILEYPESFLLDYEDSASIVLDDTVITGNSFAFGVFTPHKTEVNISISKKGAESQYIFPYKLKKGLNKITLDSLPECSEGSFDFAYLFITGKDIGLSCLLGMEPEK